MRGSLAIDSHLTRFAGFGPGFQLMRGGEALNRGGDLPAKGFGPAGQILGGGTSEAATGGKKGHRFQDVGLARAIRAGDGDGAAVKGQPGGPVAAEMRQREGFDRETAHRNVLSVQTFEVDQTRIGMTT